MTRGHLRFGAVAAVVLSWGALVACGETEASRGTVVELPAGAAIRPPDDAEGREMRG